MRAHQHSTGFRVPPGPEVRHSTLGTRDTFRSKRASRDGFTLIELILVMAILTVAISIAAPALANFFRGRSLDSEARRLLSLTRQGQSRAISEGIPVDLWVDSRNGTIGLLLEPSFEPEDPHPVEFQLDPEMQIQVVEGKIKSSLPERGSAFAATSSGQQTLSAKPNLPRIRFLPDGSVSESSPTALQLVRTDGTSLWLVQAKNKASYELRDRYE